MAAHADKADCRSVDLSASENAELKAFLQAQAEAATFDWGSLANTSVRCAGSPSIHRSAEIWSRSPPPAGTLCKATRYSFRKPAARAGWQPAEQGRAVWMAGSGGCERTGRQVFVEGQASDASLVRLLQSQRTLLDRSTALRAGNTICSRFMHCELFLGAISAPGTMSADKDLHLHFGGQTESCDVALDVGFRAMGGEWVPWSVSCAIP